MAAQYDLVIAGGGMAGASLAVALLPAARAFGLRIALVERFPLPPEAGAAAYQPSYDARVTALAYGSRHILDAMGVWKALRPGLAPLRQIEVSDRGHLGATHLRAEEEGVDALGYVVENPWLGRVLLDHLQQQGKGVVDLLCPAEVLDARPHAGGMSLSVESEGERSRLTADLLVLADGGRSALRECLGIDSVSRSYQQCALVATLSLSRDPRGIAYERFTEQGPIALLPLLPQNGEHRAGLVWTLPLAEVDEHLAWNDRQLLQRLQQRFGRRAGQITRIGERSTYPLALTRSREQVRANLVVLGNAAHGLHPIAGQGFNLALRGVAQLAETLIEAARAGRSLGELSHLVAYQQRRESDQQQTIFFSDRLLQLFSTGNPAAVVTRNLGLIGLQLLPPARSLLARHAMGLSVPAPNLRLEP